ncbi:MAG: hypothetical protein QM500_08275 [Methylococcales bacterium]
MLKLLGISSEQHNRRAMLIAVSIIITFILLRSYLYFMPSTNLDVGSYNIHHLFVGVLLITVAGVPLILFNGMSRFLELASIAFGSGLSLILDEWVYLIVTDGSDSAYLLPVSFWGAVAMIILALIYIIILSCYGSKIIPNHSVKKE